MTEPEGSDRKRKIRRAHRASATRLLNSAYEIIGADDVNVAKLRQQQQSIEGKIKTLTTLDEEILNMVEEEELDREIEEADVVKERLTLCLIDIDAAIVRATNVTPPTPVAVTIPLASATPTTAATPTTRTPTPAAPTTMSTPPTDTPPITGTTPGTATTDGIAGTIPTASATTPIMSPGLGVKLPKLTIRRFNGDLTKWVPFWDAFESAVHNNRALTDVDRFNYLRSYLESTAADSIAGLTLTSANYTEAIATLKKRFGNTQLIVNKHMEGLLSLPTVSSQHDVKGLRRLSDAVESHVRGLRALGVPAESYGGMLVSIVMNKLPSDIRLIVSREMDADHWEISDVLTTIDREVTIRERAMATTETHMKPKLKTLPTMSALASTTYNRGNQCVYCSKDHLTTACDTVKDVQARREALRQSGRCYICLRRGHISRNCRSALKCSKCNGRHHETLCKDLTETHTGTVHGTATDPYTLQLSTNVQTPVLLQTAKTSVSHPSTPTITAPVRILMDSGSQRTYITRDIKEKLKLPVKRSESLLIKTFGSSGRSVQKCELVEFGLRTRTDGTISMSALVVPLICQPLMSQPTTACTELYEHLNGIELADPVDERETLKIDLLVGSDHYWDLATGNVRQGGGGPTAIETRLGWILSGPVESRVTNTVLSVCSSHTLKVEACVTGSTLDDQLKKFWELESLGVAHNEMSVYEEFTQKINFNGTRYEVCLPWKPNHPPLPDHYEHCKKRLTSLLMRLRQTPALLSDYDSVIKEQLSRGMVERVDNPHVKLHDRVHYLPHHGVVRQDKATTKLRVVYDASARTSGPSLNDCLYAGPSFGQSIFDILIRFRYHKIVVAGDIEKAFLMIAVHPDDRDALRFLWYRDVTETNPEVIVCRFTRVAFGVSSSPFLLNATLKHHIETYKDTDPQFVKEFLSSVYVDDVSLGSENEESAYKLYLKSKTRLAEAGFKLRKFITNSDCLQDRIELNERSSATPSTDNPREEDMSYAKSSLNSQRMSFPSEVHKILGVRWNYHSDELVFDIGEVHYLMLSTQPTKRNVVSLSARFFDPLGIMSPVTVLFKIFFQRLCEAKVEWDDPLPTSLHAQWDRILKALEGPPTVLAIPRCYNNLSEKMTSLQLCGFCDASVSAYAAVVYLRIKSESGVCVQFVAAKTRVSPSVRFTIPRLELLSALLLAKLITSVGEALQGVTSLLEPICFTDSKVALYWIQGVSKEWKQFVENRVATIRKLTLVSSWFHCPGLTNPADIPSRGMGISDLSQAPHWLSGPKWLSQGDQNYAVAQLDDIPEECSIEMKHPTMANTHSLANFSNIRQIGALINCEDHSSFCKLVRVTSLVIKFVRMLKREDCLALSCLDKARTLWMREIQANLPTMTQFPTWKHQFGLYLDEFQVWRCKGRLSNSTLSAEAKHPILLDKGHYVATLIVQDAHKRVLHNGVKETLTEIRSQFWLIRGRQFVRKILHRCTVCRRIEGNPYKARPQPPLPEYRVTQVRPFQYIGVDFAGPLYVKPTSLQAKCKVWLCLYTCCSTRAVHLELVPNLNAFTFIRCFKRFTARRGIPARVISDNAKTFKSASKIMKQISTDATVNSYLINQKVQWSFNLERAPWWGGFFERMIKSAKRCLKKTIGPSCLTFEELSTVIAETEAVLNSRPLTYVSTEDLEEPLTPSHLLHGYRILSLPDVPINDDEEYGATASEITRRARHLKNTMDKFWRRWKREYLLELREHHRYSKSAKTDTKLIHVGDLVTVYDDSHPRGLWRLGLVEELTQGLDGEVRGASVRVSSKKGRPTLLRRPIQHLYPLEVSSSSSSTSNQETDASEDLTTQPRRKSTRAAATHARDRIAGLLMD